MAKSKTKNQDSSINHNPTELMDVAGVASFLGVSKSWIYKIYEEGFLPGIKLGRNIIRFRKSSIDRWLAEKESSGRKRRYLDYTIQSTD